MLLLYKIIAAILIFIVSLITIIHPLRKKSALKHTETAHLGDALASGIFLGAAFFHLLPDSIRLFNQLYDPMNYPMAEAICVFGFLFLLMLERFSLKFSSKRAATHSIPYLLALMLAIHALMEGAALGIGATIAETSVLFIAILAHKGSESFALCTTLLRHELSFQRIFYIILFFACMTPLGIFFGAFIQHLTMARNGELIAAIFNAFAAGTFLYISTLHHIHFHQHTEDAQGLIEFACLVAGAAAMGVIAIWA